MGLKREKKKILLKIKLNENILISCNALAAYTYFSRDGISVRIKGKRGRFGRNELIWLFIEDGLDVSCFTSLKLSDFHCMLINHAFNLIYWLGVASLSQHRSG